MALTQRLQLRQSQALVMTPQLMQAIKLLQLSNLDLVAYVEAELERNPLLDRSAEDEPLPAAEAHEAPAPDKPPMDGEAWSGNGNEAAGNAAEERADTNPDGTPPDDGEPGRQRTSELPAGYSEWAGVGSGGVTAATITSKRSCPPRRRWPTGFASSSSSRSPTRRDA